MQIAPSILSADFLHLEKDIQMLNSSADLIHLDVMDGSFVPNISFGFGIIKQVSSISSIPLDAHLMVVHPERWFETLAKMGVQYCSFHYEAAKSNTASCIEQIQSLGMKAGVVINPDVPVKKLFPFIGKADFFLIMSVFAGFGGQKFIYESLDRVSELRAEISKRSLSIPIEIDGGIDLSNIAAVSEAGVNIAVAGSAVFGASNPAEMISKLRAV